MPFIEFFYNTISHKVTIYFVNYSNFMGYTYLLLLTNKLIVMFYIIMGRETIHNNLIKTFP